MLEFKERTDGVLDPVFDAQLQYFLDRFYMSRISIRMLINQHGTVPLMRTCATPICEHLLVVIDLLCERMSYNIGGEHE